MNKRKTFIGAIILTALIGAGAIGINALAASQVLAGSLDTQAPSLASEALQLSESTQTAEDTQQSAQGEQAESTEQPQYSETVAITAPGQGSADDILRENQENRVVIYEFENGTKAVMHYLDENGDPAFTPIDPVTGDILQDMYTDENGDPVFTVVDPDTDEIRIIQYHIEPDR
jgi:hypothetical protein